MYELPLLFLLIHLMGTGFNIDEVIFLKAVIELNFENGIEMSFFNGDGFCMTAFEIKSMSLEGIGRSIILFELNFQT